MSWYDTLCYVCVCRNNKVCLFSHSFHSTWSISLRKHQLQMTRAHILYVLFVYTHSAQRIIIHFRVKHGSAWIGYKSFAATTHTRHAFVVCLSLFLLNNKFKEIYSRGKILKYSTLLHTPTCINSIEYLCMWVCEVAVRICCKECFFPGSYAFAHLKPIIYVWCFSHILFLLVFFACLFIKLCWLFEPFAFAEN